MTLALVGMLVGAWSWRASVFRAKPLDVGDDSPRRIKDEYPTVWEATPVPTLPADTAQAVVSANPFSPERRRAAQPVSPDQAEISSAVTPPPQLRFLYKGRINLGKRQRAVVEEMTGQKTYFLEVGQEAAGFKVLDITENRVVLSDLQTGEEVVVSVGSTDRPAP